MDVILLVVSFAVILAGALLFTNAVEWIGHRLEIGEGAVGSLLAAVGTAMPETLIAIVALVGATKSEDVAIGAIVGAPFLLATLAMGLVGLFAYLYRRRRRQGSACARTCPPSTATSSSSLSSSRSRWRSASAPPPRCGFRPASPSSSPIRSTSGGPSSAAARLRTRRRSIR